MATTAEAGKKEGPPVPPLPPAAPAMRKKTDQEIVAGFNQLRAEQRGIANKIFELETDLNEHGMVVDNIKDLEGDRKCYRLIGGILVETTVEDVLPNLSNNMEQIKATIESMNKRIEEKGSEILAYKDANNIQFQGTAPTEQSQPSKS